jgi:TM2 domain-containing membrane protein YozV
MPNAWFVQVMGEQIGPLSDDQLREMVAKKQLTPDDSIRKGTSVNWVPASRVRGLFDQAAVSNAVPIGTKSSGPLLDGTTTISGDELDKVLGIKSPPPLPTGAANSADFRNSNSDPPLEQTSEFRSLISCPDCGKRISPNANNCPNCGHSFFRPNRSIAIALAWLLGGIGVHKFYLRKPNDGLFALLFCWTFIPAIFAIVEGFQYLSMDDESFVRKFGAVPYTGTSITTNRYQIGSKKSDSTNRRWLIWAVVGFVLLLMVIGALSDHSSRQNYDSGNSSIVSPNNRTRLLDKTAVEWQSASYEDKYATCELALIALWRGNTLRPHVQSKIGSVSDLAPYTRELVVCVDAATRRDPDPVKNQQIFRDVKVHQIIAAGVVTMGWGD